MNTAMITVVTGVALFAAACSGGSSSSAAAGSSQYTKALAYAQCMRHHGVPNFPDPNSKGQITLTPSDGVNINSAQYQSAAKTCQSLAPSAVSVGQQAQIVAGALKFARCMRSHGITDFPDPNAQGGFEIKGGGDLNPSSPQYKSAQTACHHYLSAEPGGGQTVTSGGGGGL
jgi:hypothetical protein